jgi:hypothetical protein
MILCQTYFLQKSNIVLIHVGRGSNFDLRYIIAIMQITDRKDFFT